MNHLRDSEIVDLLDNLLPAARARHVAECSTCAEKVQSMRGALARVAEDDVPEPSPLFWAHFSARVREGVKDVTPGDASLWTSWVHHTGVRWALVSALTVVIIFMSVWRTDRPVVTVPAPNSAKSADAHDALDNSGAVDDPAWDLVRALADEVQWTDQVTPGLEAQPGTVDRAVLSLKGEERAELVRLLEAETKRPGA